MNVFTMKRFYFVMLLFVTMSIVACETDDIIPVNQEESIDFPTDPTNPYQGKKISIISHSRGTYSGYIPKGNRSFYPKGDVVNVKFTWWWKLINALGAKLEINESFSAGRVSNTHPTYPSFIDRVGNLGNPDVILFWGGINDQRKKTSVGTLDFSTPLEDLDESKFASALDKLVRLMFQFYPNAEVIIFIEDKLNDQGYIDVLREVADHYELKTVDLTDLKATTLDGVHHDANGMQQIVDETLIQLGI